LSKTSSAQIVGRFRVELAEAEAVVGDAFLAVAAERRAPMVDEAEAEPLVQPRPEDDADTRGIVDAVEDDNLAEQECE